MLRGLQRSAVLSAALFFLFLSACSGPEKPKPASLGENPASVAVRVVWSNTQSLGVTAVHDEYDSIGVGVVAAPVWSYGSLKKIN